ncbi:MAG: RNA polymerase sigma factor [Sandarakinorhabdus sp.]|nr:RNA polymerase sigma factor [Sandarakinorhabdus sp.]
MRRHEARLYRLIRSLIGSDSEAVDLVQESFVAAWLALKSYDPARPFGTWLARIAINKSRDWGRRRAVRRLFTFAAPLEGGVLEIADDAIGAEVMAADRQRLTAVARELAKLPAPLKEPLILCAVDGLSQANAAEVLGISEKAVETRIRRARAKLAEILCDA